MIQKTIQVTLKSPLHIGGEVRRGTFADRPLLKTEEGLLYIPATSIKGRLRHEVEMILRQQNINYPRKICQPPTPERMCQSITGIVCPVCELFGSPWQESKLYFSDLRLSGEYAKALHLQHLPPTNIRDSVTINRKRRVAEDQRKFTTELFEPGIDWTLSGTINCRVPNEVMLTPLYLAARSITMMGGSRSRGLGWCEVLLTPDEDLNSLWQQWEKLWQNNVTSSS